VVTKPREACGAVTKPSDVRLQYFRALLTVKNAFVLCGYCKALVMQAVDVSLHGEFLVFANATNNAIMSLSSKALHELELSSLRCLRKLRYDPTRSRELKMKVDVMNGRRNARCDRSAPVPFTSFTE
jgi:hypothetical protein